MDSTLAVFWRYKWVFIVVLALVLGVGGVWGYYTSSAPRKMLA